MCSSTKLLKSSFFSWWTSLAAATAAAPSRPRANRRIVSDVAYEIDGGREKYSRRKRNKKRSLSAYPTHKRIVVSKEGKGRISFM